MPNSRQARRIRRAISPRLAMTTFSSMATLFDYKQGLTELDRVAIARHDRGHPSGLVGLDLVHHLHGLDDAEHVARLDLAAELHERLGTRSRRRIEGADHRGRHGLVR